MVGSHKDNGPGMMSMIADAGDKDAAGVELQMKGA
jgi:hypothetical protein